MIRLPNSSSRVWPPCQPRGLRRTASGRPRRSLAAGRHAKIDPASVNTPYAAIAAGKVDIEGGLVDVAARAAGIVREVLVQEGDKVKKPTRSSPSRKTTTARLSRNRVAAQLQPGRSPASDPRSAARRGGARREAPRSA